MGYLVQLKYKLRAFKILCQRVITVLGDHPIVPRSESPIARA